MNYRIKSGDLYMSKRFFGKEILKGGSPLRRLLGMDGKWSTKVMGIEKVNDLVHVTYGIHDVVYLDDDFKRFIAQVKKDYEGELRGQIIVSKIKGMMDFLDVTINF